MNTNKTETKPDSAATSGRVLRHVSPFRKWVYSKIPQNHIYWRWRYERYRKKSGCLWISGSTVDGGPPNAKILSDMAKLAYEHRKKTN